MNFSWAVLEQPQTDGDNFTLTWIESLSVNPDLFTYHVSVTPEASYTFTGMGLTIKIIFDVDYNVSVVASHLCGQATQIVNIGLYHCELLQRMHVYNINDL